MRTRIWQFILYLQKMTSSSKSLNFIPPYTWHEDTLTERRKWKENGSIKHLQIYFIIVSLIGTKWRTLDLVVQTFTVPRIQSSQLRHTLGIEDKELISKTFYWHDTHRAIVVINKNSLETSTIINYSPF